MRTGKCLFADAHDRGGVSLPPTLRADDSNALPDLLEHGQEVGIDQDDIIVGLIQCVQDLL